MFLSLTVTGPAAPDLGFLLHKHPGRAQAFELPVGTAHVFYPEAGERRCTAALLVEVDPVALVRGRTGRAAPGFTLGQYVNDRPYAASSMLAVALGAVFRTAMAGRCAARPERVGEDLPLEITVPALPCRGGPELAARLFGPLGWRVHAGPVPLDPEVPGWGDSRYVGLTLAGNLPLSRALHHLYVLLPVLDDAKHYWVGPDEVDKLVRAGSGWLAGHPDKDLITRRYLAHRGVLARAALARLAEVDDLDPDTADPDTADPDTADPATADPATAGYSADPSAAGTGGEPDRPVPLDQQRRGAVLAALRAAGARRVADIGCGEGKLVADLLADAAFTEVIATDVAVRALELAAARLRLDRMPPRRRERLRMFQSSVTYRDERLAGLDAAVLMEVIEHVEESRLGALEAAVFGAAAPPTVVVTTPNAEYNVRFAGLAPGARRHPDHRFEWDREQFAGWASRVAGAYGYTVRLLGVGPEDPDLGAPTQMAVLSLRSASIPGGGGR